MKLKRFKINENKNEKPILNYDMIANAFIDEKFGNWEVSDVIGDGKNEEHILNFWNKETDEDYAVKFKINEIEYGFFDYDNEHEGENAEFIPTERFKL